MPRARYAGWTAARARIRSGGAWDRLQCGRARIRSRGAWESTAVPAGPCTRSEGEWPETATARAIPNAGRRAAPSGRGPRSETGRRGASPCPELDVRGCVVESTPVVNRSVAFLPVILFALSACSAPKEAQDPADILAEDPAFLGGMGEEPLIDDQGRTSLDEKQQFDDEAEAEPLASHTQCARAHWHLEELGYDLGIERETDPERKEELRRARSEYLSSPTAEQRVESGARDCVAQGTTAKEARCIASVRSASEINACIP